ncbi:MAG: hypothetical protein AAF628_13635 [Planctomycetota bacterium]
MRPSLLLPFAVATTVSAQIPPALVYQDTSRHRAQPPYAAAFHPSTGLGLSASSSLQQIEMRPHSRPGTWRMALTVRDPAPRSLPGQAGGSDVLEAVWDPSGVIGGGPFLWTNRAAAFNTAADERSFSISHDGLVGAADSSRRPHWQRRAVPLTEFATPTRPVTGMPGIRGDGPAGQGFVDTALCQIAGQLSWAYIDPDGDISTSDFDPFAAIHLTNAVRRLRFAQATTTAASLHSPHAIEDVDDDALAWIAAVLHAGTGDSDTYFFPALNDASIGGVNTGQCIWDDPFWQANGGPFGASGTLFVPHHAPDPQGYKDPLNLSVVAHNGGLLSPSRGSQRIRVWVPDDGNSGPWLAGVLFGTTPVRVGLRFTHGNGLGEPRPAGVLGVLPLGNVLVAPATGGGATFSLPVPATMPTGLGPFLLTQSFAANLGPIGPGGRAVYLGNTAWLGT